MMKAYEATATIAAAPEAVWKVLLDGQSYTQWDSGVIRLEGTIARASGSRLPRRPTPAARSRSA